MFMTAHVMGITKSTVHRAIHSAMSQILLKFSQLIRFPTNLNQVKRDFEAKFNMPGIIRCIDCVHVKIKSTSREVGEIFHNRKGYFSINVQAVCGPDYMFYDAVIRWQGSAHDARIFEWSALYDRLETRQLTGILLGDSGYPLLPFCLTPYRNPVTVQQNRKKLIIIDKKMYFFQTREVRLKSTEPLLKLISCTFIVHNICQAHHDDINAIPEIRIHAMEIQDGEEIGDEFAGEINRIGNSVRDEICKNL